MRERLSKQTINYDFQRDVSGFYIARVESHQHYLKRTTTSNIMTRHGKNNTASSVYTYHERQRDTKHSGYGTQRQRLGKDSVKDFNACNLTLQACRIPVIT